jgi:hypothetical protein
MDLPPPSYTEATTNTPPSSNPYLATRAAPQTSPPEETLAHIVDLSAAVETAPFPSPEATWASRDITHQDWSTFLSQLAAHLTASKLQEDTSSDRAKQLVAEWNAEFFVPRRCIINIATQAAQAAQASQASDPNPALSSDDNVVLGFKWDDKFIGLAFGGKKPITGYGLKLGNLLLGVSTGSAEKDKDKKESGAPAPASSK